MPFKMTGKSPLTKALVGKQGNLPPALKAEIKASPGKMKKSSPAKVGEVGAIMRSLSNSVIRKPLDSEGSGLSEKEYQARKIKEQQEKSVKEGEASGKTGGDSNQNKFDPNVGRTKGGKLTYSQAYKNASASVKEKYGNSEAAFTKAAKEYNAKQKEKNKKVDTLKVTTTEPLKVGPTASGIRPVMGDKIGGREGFSTVKVGGSGGAKAERKVKKGVSNNLLGRSGYTTGSGTNIKSKREGSKFKDGGKDVTTSTSVNDKLVKTRNVSKGASGSGDRIVTKKKYNKDGTVRKTVIKGKKGGKRIDKKVNLPKAKKAEVKSEEKKPVASKFKVASGGGAPSLKGAGQGLTGVTFGTKKEKNKKKSPGKMVKSPAKNYKKGYYK